MRSHLTVLAASLAVLAACATPFNADVTGYQAQLPTPQGQSFAVVAEDPALAGGLEFSQYASLVAAQMQRLSPVLSPRFAYDDFDAVVLCQELPLARQAASVGLSVGARWFADISATIDATLTTAVPLLETGFPFVKRSLFSKHSGFAENTDLLAALERAGHPLDAQSWR